MRTSLVRLVSRRSIRWVFAALCAALFAAPISRATTVIEPSFDELVNQADYIVRAVVKSVVPENRLMPDGSHTIFSKVTLEVKEVVAGTPPSPLVLDVLGGTYGGRVLAIEGTPQFTVGDEAIYFVQGNGHQIYPLVRMMHGVYPIEKDATTKREYVARSSGEPLVDAPGSAPAVTSTDRSAQVAQALSPAAFVNMIRAAAHEPHLLEKRN